MNQNLQFTNISQNDKEGIEYVKSDYDTDPAKGLIHGLQKDAIQNSVGAALSKKFKNWKVTFELLKIHLKDSLVFVDEGTSGLIGDILTQEKIMALKAEGKLKNDDHLSRFRTVFNSGGNAGPGSYGRGKLVFQACSKSYTILCDSLRSSDGKYIAFKRTINNLQLQESKIFEDNEAKSFIQTETGGTLKPLTSTGTRIIILDLDDVKQRNGISIKDSFLRSFDNTLRDDECELSFHKMIEETWWELILKYGVNILLINGTQEKEVKLTDPIKSIVTVKNNQSGWKVYEKENIQIDINGGIFYIKQLRFVVSPKGETLPENFQKITTQRKKMKIGLVGKGIPVHASIKKNFSGFLVFDESLEDLLLQPENMTHYGYKHLGYAVLKKIKSEVEFHLLKFQKELGLSTEGANGALAKTLNDALKDINEQAKDLGLFATSGLGKKKSNFKIEFINFPMPRPGKFRLEYEDRIKLIKVKVCNLMGRKFVGKVRTYLSQDKNTHIQVLDYQDVEVIGGDFIEYQIPEFSIDKQFYYGNRVLFKIEVENEGFSNSRFLWLGLEPELKAQDFIFKLNEISIDFPRQESRRVEIGEIIKNLSYSILNTTANDIEMAVHVRIKRMSIDDNRILDTLFKTEATIKSLTEMAFKNDEINISQDKYGFFENETENTEKRKCRLEILVLANMDYPKLNIIKGQSLLSTKKIDFYVGVDDPGMSIFKGVKYLESDSYSRRSWYETEPDGYVFVFNSGHNFFKKIAAYPEMADIYIKEEMLKSAYNICLKENVLSGIFEEDSFLTYSYTKGFNEEHSKEDLIKIYENLLSKAHEKIS